MLCVGVVVLNSSTYKVTSRLTIPNIIFIAHEYSFIGCKFSSNRTHKKAHSNKVNQNAHYIEIKIVGSNAGTNRLFLYKSLIE